MKRAFDFARGCVQAIISRPAQICLNFTVAAAILWPGLALSAETWPSRPVTIVAPYSVGGPSDVSTRALAVQLSKQFGQPFVVLNKPGAGGNIGADFVAKSAPDGYTLLMGANPTNAINPELLGVPYDPIKDFRFVGLIAHVPNVLVVNKDFPATTAKDLISYLREHPGKVDFGGTVGSPGQLSGELFMKQTDTQMLFVPYPGAAPASQDLMAGRIQVMFDNIANALPLIESGRTRPLAVTTATRAQSLKDVPTLEETGLTDFNMSTWWGIMAPAKTPDAIVNRLNAEMLKALDTEEVRKLLVTFGSIPHDIKTPKQFGDFVEF